MLSLLLALLASGPDRLPPVDQCGADASFAAFRTALAETIERRDAAALLAVIADDIEVDFGGGAGRDYFAEAWNLERPHASGLWAELDEALRLGCTLVDGRAAAPSMFTTMPADSDPFASAVAVVPGTALHAAPDPASAVVARLDWHILALGDWDGSSEWVPASLSDGRSGHVRHRDIRSPIDYRAIFEKVGGRWRITAFIAGD